MDRFDHDHLRLAMLVTATVIMVAAPSTGWCQGTLADYERAEQLRDITRNTVFRDRVEPHWSESGDHFWYRIGTDRDSWKFILVDAVQGNRSVAFDHQRLAELIKAETEADLTATALPVDDIAIVNNGQTLRITVAKKVWIVDRGTGGIALDSAEPENAKPQTQQSDRPQRRGDRRSDEESTGTVSPDGKWLAFVRDHRLWIRPAEADADTAVCVGIDGSPGHYYEPRRIFWSPDSRHVAAFKTRQGEEHEIHFVESAPDGQIQPKLHSLNYLKPGDAIPQSTPRLFNIDSMREVPIADDLFPNPWMFDVEIRWSPDSSRFYFVYNQRGHQSLRVISVTAADGQVTAIVDEASNTFIDYAYKQFLHFTTGGHELVWMSERDGWNHLYLYDALSGDVKNQITTGQWVVREVTHVDDAERQIWFSAGGINPEQDPYYQHHCRIGFDGTGLVDLTPADGDHTVAYSPDRRFVIDTWSRVDQPPVTELRRTSDGGLVCELERADWSRLLKTGWQIPERFDCPGRDGQTRIYGVIFRPTTFNAERRYPVIEKIYAGPHGSFVPKSFSDFYSAQELAEIGFVVVQIDGMGTSNRSKAFHDVCWRNLGDSGFPDRIEWIRAAAESRPWMDLSHGVGIYGGSAGGQSSTRALLAHGDFYTVGVSDCGCHDNRMDKIWWNELWMGWPIGPHYAEQSNVTQAHRLTGKLFLTVGEVDRNVDPASTMQVVDALIKADKDFDLLVVPGGGHGIGESKYGKRRRSDFFVRHLLNVEPRHSAAQ